MLFRLAMAAGGLCMMIPGTASDVVGLVMVGGIVLILIGLKTLLTGLGIL